MPFCFFSRVLVFFVLATIVSVAFAVRSAALDSPRFSSAAARKAPCGFDTPAVSTLSPPPPGSRPEPSADGRNICPPSTPPGCMRCERHRVFCARHHRFCRPPAHPAVPFRTVLLPPPHLSDIEQSILPASAVRRLVSVSSIFRSCASSARRS